jgi:hypothetical protein
MFSLWPPLMSDMQNSHMVSLEAEDVAVLLNVNAQKEKTKNESYIERQSWLD